MEESPQATSSSRAVSVVPPASVVSPTNDEPTPSQRQEPDSSEIDFIGPSYAVKELFSIPYTSIDRGISVAVHNLEGTLLIDGADTTTATDGPAVTSTACRVSTERRRPRSTNFAVENDEPQQQQKQQQKQQGRRQSWELMTLPLEQQHPSDALALINTILQQQQAVASTDTSGKDVLQQDENNDDNDGQQQQLEQHEQQLASSTLELPPPEHYAGPAMPPEPREYLPWKFQDLNLLVGSDALVVRKNNNDTENSNNTQSPALFTVRVAEASELRSQLNQHEEMVRQGQFVPDYRPRSYAEALAAQQHHQQQQQHQQQRRPSLENVGSKKGDSPLSAPDLEQVRLQTCILPSTPGSCLGGLLSPPTDESSSEQQQQTSSVSSSPVCTVLDVYLDNIMANVPQLALCLREKGFIESVKLMQTEDIPSTLMHPSTLDTTSPFGMMSNNTTTTGEPLFSPQIMEMNASMLLRFLRANCTRDNSTYLLRREAGQTNIQLYDISSISAQRQRKWIWWLAMMSYRFALRLGQLSSSQQQQQHSSTSASAMKRSFRARQRSLLQNAMDLLQDLCDMDGGAHETIRAAISENLADTFLYSAQQDEDGVAEESIPSTSSSSQPIYATSIPSKTSSSQPYGSISVDALNKAQDHLVNGIRMLQPVLERAQQKEKRAREKRQEKKRKNKAASSSSSPRRVVVVVHGDGSSSSSSSSEDEESGGGSHHGSSSFGPLSIEAEAVTMQLFGLHHKLINVSLRLAEHHLNNYWSSSAMQALRTAARRMADALVLLRPLGSFPPGQNGSDGDVQRLQQSVRYQFTWLWDHCGVFARSFAADELWRVRGHACGDDVVSLLRDVESAFSFDDNDVEPCPLIEFSVSKAPISKKTNNLVSLHSLSALVTSATGGKPSSKKTSSSASVDPAAVEAARAVLDRHKPIQRDRRRVLVAACVSYSRAIGALQHLVTTNQGAVHNRGREDVSPTKGGAKPGRTPELLGHGQEQAKTMDSSDCAVLALLQQRLGDACNEIGKILLNELRTVLTESSPDSDQSLAAGPLLSSAQFWFTEGLASFAECKDLRNVALLRCNLCQCCKLRANNVFAEQGDKAVSSSDGSTHAERCLQEAVDHLSMAHETLGLRDLDPMTWDMVSEELAATLLVLGVRRRQSLLGGASTLIIMQALRLTPGKEKSIVVPMERSLKIYEDSGNAHQAAAAHYQLALFYSKVWTCQRDEMKTREKLAAAFKHYSAAHAFFSGAPRGNEPTFVILCLDISNLYSAVSGEECLSKALARCLDTSDSFSTEAVNAALERDGGYDSEWFTKMTTLASSVEERVFKLLMSLVKLEKELQGSDGKYKDLYRVGLTAKMTKKKANETDGAHSNAVSLTFVYDMLTAIKEQYDKL